MDAMKIFRHYISEEQQASGEFRARLLEAMDDVDVEEEAPASEFVDLAWCDFWAKLPSWAQQDEVQMRRRWFAEHCATVLGRFRATRQKFRSPKRRRTSTPQDPAEFRTVADCYALKNSNTDEHKLQCHLIHAPKAVRVIEGQNKMNGQTEKTSVLNIVVADHTGPLHVDLWGSVGEKFLQDVAAAAEQSDEPLPLEISYFFVRRDTRVKWLTPIVRARTSARTTIEQIDRPTQSSVEEDTTTMSSSLYVRDFSCLTQSPPFKISIAGVVQNAGRVTQSQNGTDMQRFALHDATGRHVTCIAFGRHAGSTAIEDGKDIIVYFASGVAGRANKPGALWLYDEAHVAALQAQRVQPRATVHMELR
jgi:hypothetical protein